MVAQEQKLASEPSLGAQNSYITKFIKQLGYYFQNMNNSKQP